MPHGSKPTRTATGWRHAVRRGAILGGVAALHLALLMLLLQLPPYRPASSSLRSDDALRIRFFPRPTRPSVARHKTVAAPRPFPVMRRAASGAASPTTPPVLPRPSGIALPPADATPPDYRTGSFDTDLAGARPSGTPRLPGSDAPLRTGIRLQVRSSMKDVVHAMTVSNRCKYERMKMQASTTQFITPQLMERALDADGCGPQGERSPADAVIENVSRRAIFGD